ENKITMSRTVEEWSAVMGQVFSELFRVTAPGGWVAFEVGEVSKGKIKLEEYVVPLGLNAGFKCLGIIINLQEFTKTSNIWGVGNNKLGTNTNRIALFYKDLP
ncbi:MAG: site-specific DNA-methyltransferase, partial [Firmicutes bacterium]|nr:site-specific DNA-methyltransferase [Bacillota bacterium]